MDFLPGIVSGASTLVLFCVLGGTLLKVLQISADVKELKEMLRRGATAMIPPATVMQSPVAQTYVPPSPMQAAPFAAAAPPAIPDAQPGPISPEDLVRAVHAQGYDAIAAEIDLTPPRS